MIAIKGMEKMPEACSDCDLCRGHICIVTGIDIVANPKGSCPLVEIVTCKKCRHYKYHGANGYCSKRVNTDSHTDVYREPDYFCALGER
jgi:hypothetical protein